MIPCNAAHGKLMPTFQQSWRKSISLCVLSFYMMQRMSTYGLLTMRCLCGCSTGIVQFRRTDLIVVYMFVNLSLFWWKLRVSVRKIYFLLIGKLLKLFKVSLKQSKKNRLTLGDVYLLQMNLMNYRNQNILVLQELFYVSLCL